MKSDIDQELEEMKSVYVENFGKPYTKEHPELAIVENYAAMIYQKGSTR